MTSVAVPLRHFEQQTTEIFETDIHYDTINSYDEDEEMMDSDHNQTLVENGYDDQDTYNADIESTVVEPPQSDAVLTHAPSTILDEMEYLDEIDYEETEPDSKPSLEIPLIQESDIYKAETTTAQTPPAHSPEQYIHPQIFSPASRKLSLPRPSTPLLSNLVTSITTTTEEEAVDDDWPICLHTPTGQEYMLFRSDGDTEALFEDNWLKSQPLEALFSSIRQALENELASLTTSFTMDEIVLAIPDLEVSIAEDNCYTREISLQDLVNLINALCAKNGTERASTCKLQLSLQPRFIARFNQLVSLTSQIWESSKPKIDSDEHDEEDVHDEEEEGTGEIMDEEIHEEEYEEFEAAENVEELQAEDSRQNRVKFQDQSEDAGDHEDGLTAAEEDELYEGNDESYDPDLQSTEAVIDDDDVIEEFEEELDDDEEYKDVQGEEEHHEEQVRSTDVAPEKLVVSSQHNSENGNEDDDDLISYEEAADQAEDGQDYRQQYINEETSTDTDQNRETNLYQPKDEAPEIVPQNGNHIEGKIDDLNDNVHMSDTDILNSKRPLDEVVDPSIQSQMPPSKRTKS